MKGGVFTFGYYCFEKLFFQLEEEKRKRVLQHIFSLQNILVYSIVFRDNKIIFRLFDGYRFYQFVFRFSYTKGDSVVVTEEMRYYNCIIYLYNFKEFDEKNLDSVSVDNSFICLLLSDNEESITQMFYSFL